MGAAKSSQADWKDMRNIKQYGFSCPEVRQTINGVMGLKGVSSLELCEIRATLKISYSEVIN